jgi:hypothetical protein
MPLKLCRFQRLHELYKFLREQYNLPVQHELAARECLRNLREFVELCHKTGDCYENYSRSRKWQKELPRRKIACPETWINRVRLSGTFSSNTEFQCFLQENQFKVDADPAVSFEYVEYEFPGICRNHIDELFLTKDHLPAVGENKAEGDTDLFLALIQGLTYATEISTRRQYDDVVHCLITRYGKQILQESSGPFVDLYLLAAGTPTCFDVTRELVQACFETQPSLGQIIRRVVCFQPFLADAQMHLKPRFVFGEGFSAE